MSQITPTLLIPPTLTTAQLSSRLLSKTAGGIKKLWSDNIAAYNTMFDGIWNNPDSLTPTQAIAALGPKCAEIFYEASLLATMINSLVANTVPTTYPGTLTFNQDGTGTYIPPSP